MDINDVPNQKLERPLWKDGITTLRASPVLGLVHALYIGYIYRRYTPASAWSQPNAFTKGLCEYRWWILDVSRDMAIIQCVVHTRVSSLDWV
jgi:hypothetical protein